MLNHLKPGGRCGVVVPEGVLFGSTGAHKELRRKLIETNRVEAVLSLPGGVFNPYSGVKTSLLLFRKGGATERVMFLHADNDGYKLDANHDTPIDEDDLPALIEAYGNRDARLAAWAARDPEQNWTENWWFAETEAIREADWNLSASRHRPLNRSTEQHRDPLELLEELRGIEREILGEIDELAEGVGRARGELATGRDSRGAAIPAYWGERAPASAKVSGMNEWIEWILANPEGAAALASAITAAATLALVAVGLLIGSGQIAVVWWGIRSMSAATAKPCRT